MSLSDLQLDGLWMALANCISPRYPSHLWHMTPKGVRTLCGTWRLDPQHNNLVPEHHARRCRRCLSAKRAA